MNNSSTYISNYRLIFLHTDYPYYPLVLHEMMQSREVLYLKMPSYITDVSTALEFIKQADNACLSYADVLIIDEADNFLEYNLVHILKNILVNYQCDIMVVTRCLPYHSIWEDAFDQALQIISNETHSYVQDSHELILQVIAFGRGIARINGQDIPFPIGDTLHQLFFYLLENPIVTRDQVLQHFWTHLNTDSAITNFHVARQSLNQLLGVEFLQTDVTQYRLNPELKIIYDVDIYRNLVQDVTMQFEEMPMNSYQDAYALYQYDFLMTSQSAWVKPIRHELRLMQADVCYQLAREKTHSVESVGLLSQGFRYNPYREDIVWDMMNIYMDESLPCDALQVYEALTANLKANTGLPPRKDLTHLANQAKAHCP